MIRRTTRAATRGFTLIEVLVAAAMLAAIAAALATTLGITFHARDAVLAGTQTDMDARLAMEAIGRDLRTAARQGGTLEGPFQSIGDEDPQTRGNNSVSFYNFVNPGRVIYNGKQVMDGSSEIEEVTLAVVDEANLQNGPMFDPYVPAGSGAGIRYVTAQPAPGGDDGVLVRRVVRNLLSPTAQTPADQVLCRHVRAVAFSFYDGTVWTDDWDSLARNGMLPLAVQATLEIVATDAKPDRGGKLPSYTLRRIFPCACGVASTDNTGTSAVTGSSTPPIGSKTP